MLLNQKTIAKQLDISVITLWRRLKGKFTKKSPGYFYTDTEIKEIESILDVKIKTE